MARTRSSRRARGPVRKTPSTKPVKSVLELQERVEGFIDDIRDAIPYGHQLCSDLRSAVDNGIDGDESEFEQAVADIRTDAEKLVATLEAQLKYAQTLRLVVASDIAYNLWRREWRTGMVECPTCAHVFKADEHTLED